MNIINAFIIDPIRKIYEKEYFFPGLSIICVKPLPYTNSEVFIQNNTNYEAKCTSKKLENLN